MRRGPSARTFARSAILLAAAVPGSACANPIMIPGPGAAGPLGLLLALVVEVPIVAAFFPGRRLRLAVTCAIANGPTYLLLYWVLGLLDWGWRAIVVGEALATLAEATAYAAASRKPGRSLVASVVANFASFLVGGF